MQIKLSQVSNTHVELTVIAEPTELDTIKKQVLNKLKGDIKLPGFRAGHAPAELVEKNIDPNVLQTEFLENAVSQLYINAVQNKQLRIAGQPTVDILKFVPFTALEFKAKVDVIGQVKVADYKKIKLAKNPVTVSASDIDEVVESLKKRLAKRTDVDRPAKNGDEVWIDFKGVDEKGVAVKGAEGKDYPLLLGSNTFIPGFEDNLIGLKANDEKTFTLTFPKDYGVKALANRKVTFTVVVSKVQEVSLPKSDDTFATQAGPFKTLKELKADIKKQLTHERQHEYDRNYASELITKISDKSEVDVPDSLVNENIERLMQDVRQNAIYRGMTISEYLDAEGMTEDEYREKVVRPEAKKRVKASLILAEIAEREKLNVTPEEIEVQMQLLKGQYQDSQMQAELEKPETRQDIGSRILTDKTIASLVKYSSRS